MGGIQGIGNCIISRRYLAQKNRGMNVKGSHMIQIRKKKSIILLAVGAFLLCFPYKVQAMVQSAPEATRVASDGSKMQQTGGESRDNICQLYEEYRKNFESIEYRADIAACGFRVIEEQIFPIEMGRYGEVNVIPAIDGKYNRLALFFALQDGTIVYKTQQLETNNQNRGELKQPTKGISAISFQDLDGDERMDIVLITICVNENGAYAGKNYKVGDVLFQNGQGTGFYQDYRISDKINRFSMNKSIELITAFVRDGYSTEFLYTAANLEELLEHGFQIIHEQSYPRNFEKLGRLQVVPGTYRIMMYL